MDLQTLQQETKKTWGVPLDSQDSGTVAQLYLALSLADHIGRIALYSRKRIREGESFQAYRTDVSRSIGDCLWFLSELATAHNLSLEDIALDVLKRAERRWPNPQDDTLNEIKYTIQDFEKNVPEKERLPEDLRVEFLSTDERLVGYACVSMSIEGDQVGDTIDDNRAKEDHYRFHDALHLAFIVYLGWSPVMRSLLKRKRKSNAKADRIQDGARAADTEEVVVRRSYMEAERQGFYKNATFVDTSLLEEIQHMVRGLEVERLPAVAWQEAILNGYRIHRDLLDNDGGVVVLSRANRTIDFEQLSEQRKEELRKIRENRIRRADTQAQD